MFGVEPGCAFLQTSDEVGLLGASVAVALTVELPLPQAPFDALGLGIHLAESGAGVCSLALGVATFVRPGFECAVEGGDLMLELGCLRIGCGELGCGCIDPSLYFIELALERERALRTSASPSDGDVVEGLAGVCEKEGLRVLQGEIAGSVGVGCDVAVAKAGRISSSERPKPFRAWMQSLRATMF